MLEQSGAGSLSLPLVEKKADSESDSKQLKLTWKVVLVGESGLFVGGYYYFRMSDAKHPDIEFFQNGVVKLLCATFSSLANGLLYDLSLVNLLIKTEWNQRRVLQTVILIPLCLVPASATLFAYLLGVANENGEDLLDFTSIEHGWSGLPIYLFRTLLIAQSMINFHSMTEVFRGEEKKWLRNVSIGLGAPLGVIYAMSSYFANAEGMYIVMKWTGVDISWSKNETLALGFAGSVVTTPFAALWTSIGLLYAFRMFSQLGRREYLQVLLGLGILGFAMFTGAPAAGQADTDVVLQDVQPPFVLSDIILLVLSLIAFLVGSLMNYAPLLLLVSGDKESLMTLLVRHYVKPAGCKVLSGIQNCWASVYGDRLANRFAKLSEDTDTEKSDYVSPLNSAKGWENRLKVGLSTGF